MSTLASVWPSIFTTGDDGFLAYVKSIDLHLVFVSSALRWLDVNMRPILGLRVRTARETRLDPNYN